MGTPIAIVIQAVVIYVLWRRPSTTTGVIAIGYFLMTLRIAVQLSVGLFWSKAGINIQLIWLAGWMSIDYLAPFLIFRRQVASVLALATLGLWVLITGAYMTTHLESVNLREMTLIFSQLYFAHGILIVFMSLYARLRGLYLVSRKAALHMDKMANTDFLLGTANRRSIQTNLETAIDVSVSTGAPLSVILVDIDYFKQINDHYGHAAGDQVLREVTALLLQCGRSSDNLGRWGGEEFLVILPNCRDTCAHQCAERLRGSIERHKFITGSVTASFGVAEFQEGDDLDSLLKKADDALYRCKRRGRNRVEIFDIEAAT